MSDPIGLVSSANGGLKGPQSLQGPNAARAIDPADQVGSEDGSFKDLLLKQLQEVNQLQQEAADAVEDLETGKRNDVDNVIIATEKADLAFQMLLQVRNQVIEAYNEVKQTRV
ncbi:MAG: flagellar hook-basal body complex protein FliE [Planctomycetes bacterium]|nr:flagellar hook-basal body complex protein FliE [Planctomycetota bacterium]